MIGKCDECGKIRKLRISKIVEGEYCHECYPRQYMMAWKKKCREEKENGVWPEAKMKELRVDWQMMPWDELLSKYYPETMSAIANVACIMGLGRRPEHLRSRKRIKPLAGVEAYHRRLCLEKFGAYRVYRGTTKTHPALKAIDDWVHEIPKHTDRRRV